MPESVVVPPSLPPLLTNLRALLGGRRFATLGAHRGWTYERVAVRGDGVWHPANASHQ